VGTRALGCIQSLDSDNEFEEDPSTFASRHLRFASRHLRFASRHLRCVSSMPVDTYDASVICQMTPTMRQFFASRHLRCVSYLPDDTYDASIF
jgi:hypothetical protein